MKKAMLVAFVAFLVTVHVTARQSPAKTEVPTLTDMQKLVLQGKAKDLKIAELTVQAALTAYKQAQTDLQAALAAVQQPCHDLKLDDLTYVLNEKKDGCK